ncbi:hypothetical protein C8F01DRAFT_654228 [Mycena amicta]|nr:hypothetical protein C8F01DRAFT_654228 [Mycena amicta]
MSVEISATSTLPLSRTTNAARLLPFSNTPLTFHRDPLRLSPSSTFATRSRVVPTILLPARHHPPSRLCFSLVSGHYCFLAPHLSRCSVGHSGREDPSCSACYPTTTVTVLGTATATPTGPVIVIRVGFNVSTTTSNSSVSPTSTPTTSSSTSASSFVSVASSSLSSISRPPSQAVVTTTSFNPSTFSLTLLPPATTTTGAATATGAAGTNLQTFTGSLGGIAAPAVSAANKNQFQVEGTTSLFNNEDEALNRSCEVQHNDCADAANSSGNKSSFSVNECDSQQTQCFSVNGLS